MAEGRDTPHATSRYLEPGRIGPLTLKNRLVRASTSESMATEEGEATEALASFYGELAAGGAGLLLAGHIFVEPRGQASVNQSGLHRDDLVPAAACVVDAVHERGGVIFAQLGHCGSQSMMPGVTPIAPSRIPNAMYDIEPHEMTGDDIHGCIDDFGSAARRAKEAGFDGIHIHGGNGYLIAEFSSPHTNTRNDEWGRDADGRSRFFVSVYKAVRSAVGADMPVTARIGVEDSVPNGVSREESVKRARSLEAAGIDGLETTYGIMRNYLENIRPYIAVGARQAARDLLVQRAFRPKGAEAYYRPFARAIKEATSLPIILVGGIRTTETMNDIIESGDADFLAMARPFIREPDLGNKLAAGRSGMVECVSCNMCLAHDGYDPLRCWRKSPRDVARHVYLHYWRNRRTR